MILRNRRRQHHSLELGHLRVNKRKQNTRGHAKKSPGADKSRKRSARAAHTLRPTGSTVLIARMQTALAGNNSRLRNAAGRVTYVFYVWVSVHHTLIYIKKTNLMQSSSMFIGNRKIALHVSAAFCVHLQEH